MTLLAQLNSLETTGLIRLVTVQPELEYLFRHALVQDAAYGSLLKNDRKRLHQSVGEVLEQLYPQQLDEWAATLALHFEKAEQPDKAVHYLIRAGDQADNSFANAEAMAFYQSAIAQAELVVQKKPDAQWHSRLAQLLESLADVRERIGHHEAAREAYYRALEIQELLPRSDTVMQARLYRKIGVAHTLQRQFAEASQALEQAEQYLGEMSCPLPNAAGNEWIELQIERAMYHYWKNEPASMKKVSDRLLPVVEQIGTPLQWSKALHCSYLYFFRVQRYVVSDEVIATVEGNLPVAEQTGKLPTIYDHYFTAGFFHLFRRELDETEKHLHLCLELAERMGDPVRISRAANYLMFAARMRGQPDVAQSYFETVLSTTWAGLVADYTYTVKGCQAWIAWRAGKLAEARAFGMAGREILRQAPYPLPFQWVVYFPLLAVAVAENQITEACEYAQRILDPIQMILPDDLTQQLEAAIHAAETKDDESARTAFAASLKLATEYGYV
ncbi:MAG TPA: tetratricopeptide repeat protein [Blastocatellia bacterium]|nr:tetratricopeptide repeat protein [Blastocatellia bacterium]